MANSKAEKKNKNPDNGPNKEKKIKADVIVIVAVLFLIAGYIFFEAYNATHVEVETITAVTSTVYESIEAKALTIRAEHIVDSKSDGVTVACVNDGGKVKANGDIAMLFSSGDNAKRYASALQLRQELDYYIDLESKSAGMATDVASIDKDILDDVNSYIRNASQYSSGAIANSVLNLNDKLTRRQIIIGEKVDISSVKAELQEKIDELDADNCKPSGYVKTEESGVFSSFTDGLENAFDYNNIRDIDLKLFDSYMKKAAKAKATASLGKLITSYEWYFCCKVTADEVKSIKNGDVLTVALKNSDQVIQCEVMSGASLDLGVKESVLVLRCSEMNSQIAAMRVENIEIRYNEYEGFKVPTSAIHIDSEGNRIVYALVANQVAARKGEIIYSTKDYVLFKHSPEIEDSIRLYDQIITQGKDLHDGKVYT